MKVLLTFTGFHDPYAASAATGEMRSGPILTVVAECAFDRVYLFSTPRAAEISEQTAEAIRERHPAAKVAVLDVPLKDPTKMVAAGTFREDLYQRFGSSIAIPPLRSRKTDIPLLASHILTAWNARHQRQKRLSPPAVSELVRYPWPGNVRELHRVIQQSAMLAPAKTIQPADLRFEQPLRTHPLAVLPDPCEGFQLIPFLDDVKQRMIHRAMELSGEVQARAAKLLGISPQALNQFYKSKNSQ